MAVTLDAEGLALRIQGVAVPGNPENNAEAELARARAAELLAVATAHVLQYAPAAPDALHTEAAIRFAGYLSQSDFGSIAAESIGPRDVTYPTNHAAMFRNCGAAALLSRWRVRRAGAIG